MHPAETDEIDICSVNAAADILGRPLAQIQLLSGAHALGTTFRAGKTPFYRTEHIEALSHAPKRSKEDILELGRDGAIPGAAILVVRQKDLSPVDATGDPSGRRWYGFDRRLDLSEDPAERQAQDDASRMWWPIAPGYRDLINRCAAEGRVLPMLISVGGLIVSSREITGLSHELSSKNHRGRWAMDVRPSGDWARPLIDTWLNSGPGKSSLWWRFEPTN